MRIAMKILVFSIIFLSGNLAIYGCICPGVPFRTTFKVAKAVFIGKLPEKDLPSRIMIQGAKNGIVLEVEKSWKGVKGNYFSVTTEFEDYGICTAFLKKFEKGKKYLIFAEGENFEVRNYCTYSEEIYSPESPDWYKERQQKQLKLLDRYSNFWFRLGKLIRLI